MRRLFSAVALLGLAAPVVIGAPTVSVAPTPHPVKASVHKIALVPSNAVEGKRRVVAVSPSGSAGVSFSAVGVTWKRDRTVTDIQVQVRTHTKGLWSAWTSVDALDTAPDDNSKDAAGTRASSEPVWAGPSDDVQIRVDVADGAKAPEDLKAELIDPGTSAADAHPGQNLPASSASAGAVQPQIITRAQWGADESIKTCFAGYTDTVKVGFVHHTDTSNDYGPGDSAAIVRSIYVYHVQSNGWCDIGYNYLVDRYGQIFEGRWGGIDAAVLGAHTGGFNANSFAASMIGTFSTVAPPQVMLDSLERLFAWKLSRYARDPLGTTTLTAASFSESRYPTGTTVTFNVISGHRDADYTTCPGDNAYSLMGQIRQAVAADTPPSSCVYGAIGAHYGALGGSAGFLGSPVTCEANDPTNTGRFNDFQGGSIYWSPASNAWEVHGAIRGHWLALGGTSFNGFPATDESPTPNVFGRYNHFQNGSVYWSPSSGSYEVHGAIRDRWASLGWENSSLGFPISDEFGVPGGRQSNFQHGALYWDAGNGIVSQR
ncbi:MAG: N-acetylmuramoyl-L-alanine amidase [Mycobacterium sp.]